MTSNRTITVAHSPDVDDAFMYYGFTSGRTKLDGYELEFVLDEIDQLNRWAIERRYDVTAVSAHGYLHIADEYAIMGSGASVARGYGPVVVSKTPMNIDELKGLVIAVPGEFTTANLLAKLCLPEFEPLYLPFREVEKALKQSRAVAAILIHEGQIAYEKAGFSAIVDLGRWFFDHTGLPVPLGLDVVRRDLGVEFGAKMADALRRSIICARENKREALEYSIQYSPGISTAEAEKFVNMYVNDDTLLMPDDVRMGLNRLFKMAGDAGIVSTPTSLDIW